MRTDAENYATETRRAADEYASAKRDEVDQYQRDAEVSADADRKLAAEKLESAKREAEATVLNANQRSEEVLAEAEQNAQEKAELIQAQASDTMDGFIEAERTSRESLEGARTAIDSALAQLHITEINLPAGDNDAAENGTDD